MTERQILVTGGAGFIGSNFLRFVLEQRPRWRVVNLDALTYAGTRENLADVESDDRYRFVHGDIRDRDTVEDAMAGCDAVVHFAAESHVDRSIIDSGPFVSTNVQGTQVLLDVSRERGGGSGDGFQKFVHVSTDEVYGDLPLELRLGDLHRRTPHLPGLPAIPSLIANNRVRLAT